MATFLAMKGLFLCKQLNAELKEVTLLLHIKSLFFCVSAGLSSFDANGAKYYDRITGA